MPFELASRHSVSSNVLTDSELPGRRQIFASAAPINYASTPGGRVDQAIDLMDSESAGVFTIQNSSFVFELDRGTGWITYGGRRGQEPFIRRFANIGRMIQATRTFVPLDPLADIQFRAGTLTRELSESRRRMRYTWGRCWELPGSSVGQIWTVTSQGLKGEFEFDAGARTLLSAVALGDPGVLMGVQWGDIQLLRNGSSVGLRDDFSVGPGDTLLLFDGQGRRLGQLAQQYVRVRGASPNEDRERPLTLRFWWDGSNNWCFAGAESLPTARGVLVFDPDVVDQGPTQDGYERSDDNAWVDGFFGALYCGRASARDLAVGWRFDVSAISAGEEVTPGGTSALVVDDGLDSTYAQTQQMHLRARDVDDAGAFASSSANNPFSWDNDTDGTANVVADTFASEPTWPYTFEGTALDDMLAELVDGRPGDINICAISAVHDSGNANTWTAFDDGTNTNAAALTVDVRTAAAGGGPVAGGLGLMGVGI